MAKHRVIGPSAWIVGAAGLIIGVGAAWLVTQGNPGNMGLCIACFNRDITGAFGGAWANMGGVAYLRPEIIGLLFGGTVAALATREFRPRGGSSVLLRFVLGFIFMMSSLIFLGCTVRAWLRLGGGDLNALYGIAGIVVGVSVGAVFLKQGFNLGRAKVMTPVAGWVGSALMLGGCPFRQVIMSGEGDADATVAVLGMFAGALVAHRFVIASTGAGLSDKAWPALAVMLAVLLVIAFAKRERLA